MPSNTKFAPLSFAEYGVKDLNLKLTGAKFTAIAGQVTNHDFVLVDDMLIDGAQLTVINAALGDKINCFVVDVDNIFGYGANVVLGQYCVDVYMNPNESLQLDYDNAYPAKLLTGLYLRVAYTSVGASDATVLINYKLHKILW